MSKGWLSRLGVRNRLARLAGSAVLAAGLLGPSGTQTAIANGDTRTLTLYHSHTQENITITFRRDGSYDRSALEKLNWFLRDWRNDDATQMDPRLFDVVWATWREVGSGAAIRIVSAYRSPGTNAMLRRRSSGVAKNSQHIQGKAMDLHMPDVSMAKVREIGMRLQRGGVGYYPTAGTPFVHLDVGSVRSWPRMPRNQLERLFPDGKTVHIPADGTPLAGYEAALAEIQTRGGSALSYAEITSPRRSLWAALFGGEDEEVEVATPRRGRTAQRPGRTAPQVAALSTPASSGDSGSVYSVMQPQPAAPAVTAAPNPPRPAAPAKPQPVEDDEAKPVVKAPEEPKPADEAKKGPAAIVMPMPPRRPADTALEALVAAAVPVPPIRPSTLVASVDPAPPPAPVEPQPRAVIVPLPPSRPVAVAALAGGESGTDKSRPPSTITEDSGAPALPAAVAALVPARVPVPPSRPTVAATIAPAPAEPSPERAPAYRVKLDTTAMNALMSSVAAERDLKKPDKVELPSVRDSVHSRIIAGKFGGADQNGGPRGFSGGLTRPLSAGFVARGD